VIACRLLFKGFCATPGKVLTNWKKGTALPVFKFFGNSEALVYKEKYKKEKFADPILTKAYLATYIVFSHVLDLTFSEAFRSVEFVLPFYI
jgi:hypothetical protein